MSLKVCYLFKVFSQGEREGLFNALGPYFFSLSDANLVGLLQKNKTKRPMKWNKKARRKFVALNFLSKICGTGSYVSKGIRDGVLLSLNSV